MPAPAKLFSDFPCPDRIPIWTNGGTPNERAAFFTYESGDRSLQGLMDLKIRVSGGHMGFAKVRVRRMGIEVMHEVSDARSISISEQTQTDLALSFRGGIRFPSMNKFRGYCTSITGPCQNTARCPAGSSTLTWH